MPDAHAHRWTRLLLHGDGCHFTTDIVECACGARANQHRERDIKGDPYERVWLEDDCDRCRALTAGAEPTCKTRVVKGGRHAARQV